jgi:hypothetical protein
MKYKSSFTNEIKIAVMVLVSYWLVNTWVASSNNNLSDTISLSVAILLLALAFLMALTKFTYLVIEDSQVKYVPMFFQRGRLEISKVQTIQKGVIGGLFKFLFLTYEDSGKVKRMKVSPITFKKDTLKQFVSDLKTKNPQVVIDSSTNELIA